MPEIAHWNPAMPLSTPLALLAATSIFVGLPTPSPVQEDDTSRNAASLDESLVRFSFPGGSVREYADTVKVAVGGVLFGREPINFLVSDGIDAIELPRIDLVLAEDEFFEIAMKAIIGEPYQVEPDVSGMVTMDFVGGATVRIGAKYWKGLADLSAGRTRTAASVAALRAVEEIDTIGDPQPQITVFPVLDLDVVEAAEAISYAMGITEIGAESQIMAHQPTGTIIFRGTFDATELAREILEAAELVKAHQRERDVSNDEAFEEGAAQARSEAVEEAQIQISRAEEQAAFAIEDLREELDRLRAMYEASRVRIVELEAELRAARTIAE